MDNTARPGHIVWVTKMTDLNCPTRRGVLIGAAAAAVIAPKALASSSVLRAAPGMVQLTPKGGPRTPVWTYGDLPGPELRIRQGSQLTRTFQNDLPQPSSIHWHGIRIANAMDGVSYLTQDPVQPGASFDYSFDLPDAGTYWYHPHNRTWEQMARGLYGALIVEEANPPDVDQDLVLMLDDWRLAEDGSIHDSFGNMRDWSHAGRIGNWVTVNGDPEWVHTVQTGERLRLRLVNTANARIFQLGWKGLDGWIVALDGMPLKTPEAAETVTLAPAQRVDLIADVAADTEALVYSTERDGSFAIASFPVTEGTQTTRYSSPSALPPNPVPDLGNLDTARSFDLDMDGGAMGRMQSAVLDGQERQIRDLVREGYVWAFNGVAGRPKEPLARARLGETIKIKMTNRTRWPHAMHLHGHHFRVLMENGTIGPLRDTTLMAPQETQEIAFVADNPGAWLLHCHMLEHAASGMMTWITVE